MNTLNTFKKLMVVGLVMCLSVNSAQAMMRRVGARAAGFACCAVRNATAAGHRVRLVSDHLPDDHDELERRVFAQSSVGIENLLEVVVTDYGYVGTFLMQEIFFERNTVSLILQLIEKYPDTLVKALSIKDRQGYSALMIAVLVGNINIVTALLDAAKKAEIKKFDACGKKIRLRERMLTEVSHQGKIAFYVETKVRLVLIKICIGAGLESLMETEPGDTTLSLGQRLLQIFPSIKGGLCDNVECEHPEEIRNFLEKLRQCNTVAQIMEYLDMEPAPGSEKINLCFEPH